jgi:glutamate carboxypeptidase
MKILLLNLIYLFSHQIAFGVDETQLLKNLVEIPSGSSDVNGVNKIQDIVAQELKDLGFTVESIQYPNQKLGKLIVGTLPGENPKFISLIVHADTVFEKFSGFDKFEVSEDGTTATGPGVIDNKGGIVVLISGLKKYLKNNTKPKHSLRVISSPGEEVGMPEFLETFKKHSEDSKLVLGFEPCLENGDIIEARKGNRWYNISVSGVEAHAGRAHKDGVNACWELSKKLDQISKLTNYSKDLTVSIGHMEGGNGKHNIVCSQASAKIDVRFNSIKDSENSHRAIQSILKNSEVSSPNSKKTTSTKFEIADETNPFSVTKESQGILNQFLSIISKHEGKSVKSANSGGAADTNSFSRPGLPIVDGLGACGGKIHTNQEYILLKSLKTRSHALGEFLENFKDMP